MDAGKLPWALDLVAGALAGAASTAAMDRAGRRMYQLEDPQVREYEENLRRSRYPPELAAEKLLRMITGFTPSRNAARRLAQPIHFGLGAAMGAGFAGFSRRFPASPLLAGLVFGLAMWALVDELATPAFGLSPPSRRFPWQNHARSLASHAVFGGTMGVIQGLVRKAA
jgi:hypothetical protein